MSEETAVVENEVAPVVTEESQPVAPTEKPERTVPLSALVHQRQRAQGLQRELDELRRSQPLAQQAKPETAPNPNDEKYVLQPNLYLQDVAEHAARRVFESNKQRDVEQSRISRQNDAVRQLDNDIAEMGAEDEEFDTRLQSALAQGMAIPVEIQEVLSSSDKRKDLIKHLVYNPQTAIKLQGMSVVQAAREIGRIESTLNKPQPKTPPPPIGTARGVPAQKAARIGGDVESTAERLFGAPA